MEINSLLDFSQFFPTNLSSVFAFNPGGHTLIPIARQNGFTSERLSIPQQIHSTTVKWVEKPGEYTGIDGLITSKTELILTLKVADCVPVYFFEPQNKIIGLVHAGWRGTVDGIIQNTIQLMQKNGVDTRMILVYMGPAIGSCCYEVSSEVADNFNNAAKLKMDNKKWKVDLHKQISLQLITLGILAANIKASEICTFESDKCHSYRRDGNKSGRMFAFMGVK